MPNPHQLSLAQALEDEGTTLEEVLHESLFGDSVDVPACCDCYCRVEPDGTCEHGCPSVLLAGGMI